ncbi:MAG: methyltransferase domain-containing protein [Anaerolineae bacterium]|nr:methyltransferase domain-containing protein [Anaerolineae bacterium]
MTLNWLDVAPLSFNAMLLLERVQLSWLPGWLKEAELAIALHANPAVRWFFEHKCPEINDWVADLCSRIPPVDDAAVVRCAEEAVMRSVNDLLTYAVAPENYAAQEFLSYDDRELLELADFTGKIVLDIGAGTGRLTFIAAQARARAVYAVEPVGNLRHYLRQQAQLRQLPAVYAVDGTITHIPFHDQFADIVLGGHVFGDEMDAELAECQRVVKPGGQIIFCPGSARAEGKQHEYLLGHGFQYADFIEPPADHVRKYWKTID